MRGRGTRERGDEKKEKGRRTRTGRRDKRKVRGRGRERGDEKKKKNKEEMKRR